MKVAILSESPVDEAAYRVLVGRVLGGLPEAPARSEIRHRGWPAVRSVLPALMKHLVYQTDADGLVVIVDSNGTPVHSIDGGCAPRCRLCLVNTLVEQHLPRVLAKRPGRLLEVATGLAVPYLEAWLLVGERPELGEAAWKVARAERRTPYTKAELKLAVFGPPGARSRSSVDAARQCAERAADRLQQLRTNFPAGFGALEGALERWGRPG